MARYGPKTRAFMHAIMRFLRFGRKALAQLERYRDRKRLPDLDAQAALPSQQMASAFLEDQAAAAAADVEAAFAEAEPLWDLCLEPMPPLRWWQRCLAERQRIIEELDRFCRRPDGSPSA